MIPLPPALDWFRGVPDPFGALSSFVDPIDGLHQVDQVRRGLWIHATTPRPPVGTTPHQVVFRQNKLTLRHYAPQGAQRAAAPVVVIPSLINRASICDLEPDRSLVGGLARLGHPVYLVDWGVPAEEDAGDDVGKVVLGLLHRSIDRACRHAGAPAAHLFGYCQGGTLAAMYAALRPARVASLSVLNGPVKFSEGGRFRAFCDTSVFDVDRAVPVGGNVPVETMAVAFKLLDPMGNWSKFIGLERASHDAVSLGRALARERWLEENVPMPGAFAREFVKHAYQEDRLLAGTWTLRGEPVRLENIKAPTMVVVCQRDEIAPAAACKPLYDAVGGPKKLVELEAGHIGVVVGSVGPRQFYPLLDRWFRAGVGDEPAPAGGVDG